MQNVEFIYLFLKRNKEITSGKRQQGLNEGPKYDGPRDEYLEYQIVVYSFGIQNVKFFKVTKKL